MKVCPTWLPHKNDMISNALARVSRKIESLGSSKFSSKIDEVDIGYQILPC